jgi:hypothetical protein
LHEAGALDDVAKTVDPLPERSGINNRFGPATLTKPGLLPRGEASTLPSEPEVASTQNGDIAMNFPACASISGRALRSRVARVRDKSS